MATLLAPRHQRALSVPTGYRRAVGITFSRPGLGTISVEPTSATFTQDARRSMRWDGRMTIADPNLQPQLPTDMLSPFGTTCTVQLGVRLSNGVVSSVPFGVFTIAAAKVRVDANSRTTELSLVDLADRIERYRFEQPLTVPSGTDVAIMVNTVVANRTGNNPGLDPAGALLGADRTFGLAPDTGPWTELVDILEGFNRTIWYDRVGQLQIGSTFVGPDQAYSISDNVTTLSTDFDSRPYNVIVVRGEPPDEPPVESIAMDDVPTSPTYAGTAPGSSPYGRVTRYYSSPMIRTQGQADNTAVSLLNQSLGQGATSTLTRPFDPTVDANDVVNFFGNTYAVDSSTVNVTGDTSLTVRQLVTGG